MRVKRFEKFDRGLFKVSINAVKRYARKWKVFEKYGGKI